MLVLESGHRRVLSFDGKVEQSCMSLNRPARLEYVYTRAMVLSLLFHPEPLHVLLLGLGGGSLLRALHERVPGCRLTALENRPAVPDVARDWFELPQDERVEVKIGDADRYLKRNPPKFDLVFADLYLAEGMNRIQAEGSFLAACREVLTERGILVLNFWSSEFAQIRQVTELLKEFFDRKVIYLHVQGGNIIGFAFADRLPQVQRESLYRQAGNLGASMHDIPLLKLAKQLWRQNAEVLKSGRYRKGSPGNLA